MSDHGGPPEMTPEEKERLMREADVLFQADMILFAAGAWKDNEEPDDD